MESLLKHIVTGIFPESDIEIESHKEDDKTIFSLLVPKDDVGRIIGRNGKVINSIKQILKIKAMKENSFVEIEIKEK